MNHFNNNIIKFSTLCIAGSILFSLNTLHASAESTAGERPVAGITKTLEEYYASANAANTEITLAENYDYDNLGIADVDNHLNIRKQPGEDEKIIGKLPKDAGCKILEEKDGWSKIKSGKVTGYVKSSFLITGKKAVSLAKKVGSLTATVNTKGLNVREEAGLLADVVTSVPEGEELEVEEVYTEWVKVVIDSDEGFVARQYVDLSYELKKAVFVEELDSSNGVSGLRAKMVAYAKQFVGNPYVYGGNSLTNGIDCSGFTKAIYAKFGYSLSRVSGSQSYDGTRISASNAKPGDLVFYGSGSHISHVAMYIGNGQIVHASNPRTGIKISNMYYRDPIAVCRIISD